MHERTIKDVDGGYVVYAEGHRRISSYLSPGSAERAAERSLRAKGGGVLVRVDGTKVEVPAGEVPTRDQPIT